MEKIIYSDEETGLRGGYYYFKTFSWNLKFAKSYLSIYTLLHESHNH